MTTLQSNRCVCIDTETTGTDPKTAKVCGLGIVRHSPEKGFQRGAVLVNPGEPIPKEASKVHGITDDMVAAAPSIMSLKDKIQESIDWADVVLMYNAPYDRTVLENARIPMPPLDEIADPMVARMMHKPGISDKLVVVCRDYGIELTVAHNAGKDAQATLEVAFAMEKAGHIRDDIELYLAQQHTHRSMLEVDFEKWGYHVRIDWRTGHRLLGFGKHRGTDLEKPLPPEIASYLRWCVTTIGASMTDATRNLFRQLAGGPPEQTDMF